MTVRISRETAAPPVVDRSRRPEPEARPIPLVQRDGMTPQQPHLPSTNDARVDPAVTQRAPVMSVAEAKRLAATPTAPLTGDALAAAWDHYMNHTYDTTRNPMELMALRASGAPPPPPPKPSEGAPPSYQAFTDHIRKTTGSITGGPGIVDYNQIARNWLNHGFKPGTTFSDHMSTYRIDEEGKFKVITQQIFPNGLWSAPPPEMRDKNYRDPYAAGHKLIEPDGSVHVWENLYGFRELKGVRLLPLVEYRSDGSVRTPGWLNTNAKYVNADGSITDAPK